VQIDISVPTFRRNVLLLSSDSKSKRASRATLLSAKWFPPSSSSLKMEVERSSETSVNLYEVKGVISQNILFFIVPAMRITDFVIHMFTSQLRPIRKVMMLVEHVILEGITKKMIMLSNEILPLKCLQKEIKTIMKYIR
jgi:hypothetical protein